MQRENNASEVYSFTYKLACPGRQRVVHFDRRREEDTGRKLRLLLQGFGGGGWWFHWEVHTQPKDGVEDVNEINHAGNQRVGGEKDQNHRGVGFGDPSVVMSNSQTGTVLPQEESFTGVKGY